jgi:hypothetical protein
LVSSNLKHGPRRPRISQFWNHNGNPLYRLVSVISRIYACHTQPYTTCRLAEKKNLRRESAGRPRGTVVLLAHGTNEATLLICSVCCSVSRIFRRELSKPKSDNRAENHALSETLVNLCGERSLYGKWSASEAIVLVYFTSYRSNLLLIFRLVCCGELILV